MAGGEQAGGGLTLLPATTIAGAVAGQVGAAGGQLVGLKHRLGEPVGSLGQLGE